jgi:hypothetical protein
MTCNQLIYLRMITRSEGKINSTFKGDAFYKEYKKEVTIPVSKTDYSAIRDLLYKEMIVSLYNEGEFKFPFKFGTLKILKKKRRITYNSDGTINKIGYKIDWKQTKDYWGIKYPGLSQEELKLIKNKTKIYCESEWRLYMSYIKNTAHYVNKHYTWFKPSRNLARGLKSFIDSHPKIDYKEK